MRVILVLGLRPRLLAWGGLLVCSLARSPPIQGKSYRFARVASSEWFHPSRWASQGGCRMRQHATGRQQSSARCARRASSLASDGVPSACDVPFHALSLSTVVSPSHDARPCLSRLAEAIVATGQFWSFHRIVVSQCVVVLRLARITRVASRW